MRHIFGSIFFSQKRHTCSLTLKLGSGAMAAMAGTSSKDRESPHISDEEFEQDQPADNHDKLKPIDIKDIERPDKYDKQAAKFNNWFDKFKTC